MTLHIPLSKAKNKTNQQIIGENFRALIQKTPKIIKATRRNINQINYY